MEIHAIHTLAFSPAGATDKAVRTLGGALGKALGLAVEEIPFTKPQDRAMDHAFGPGDLAVVGCPTYAGRMPNKIMPDFRDRLRGNGALAVAAVTYGGRAWDNSLAELAALLTENGFQLLAAGACAARHAFTDNLGEGRPDWDDLAELRAFAGKIAEKLQALDGPPAPLSIPGDPAAPYYVPLDTGGQPAKFLKAKPQTDLSRCSGCGACARTCPMGAIDPRNFASVPGTCIKCQSCVRRCTRRAKFFDDPAFLSHVSMLEQHFPDRGDNAFFL